MTGDRPPRPFRLEVGAKGVERDVDAEIEFHIEMRTRKLVAAGVDPATARAEALRQFGDLSAVRAQCLSIDHQRERAMTGRTISRASGRTARGVTAAAMIRSSPERRLTLGEVAGKAGASPRTLERLFRGETGLAFGAWSQRARLLFALQLLAGGRSVTSVSLATGYESLSAFVAAFRRVFGTTPGRYFQADRASEVDDISGPASGRGDRTGGSRSPSGFRGGSSPAHR